MPSIAVCQCPFRLMRRCFLGRWICFPVSERFRLVWKCHLFHYSPYIQFCVHWNGGQCLTLLFSYVVSIKIDTLFSFIAWANRYHRSRIIFTWALVNGFYPKAIDCRTVDLMPRSSKNVFMHAIETQGKSYIVVLVWYAQPFIYINDMFDKKMSVHFGHLLLFF